MGASMAKTIEGDHQDECDKKYVGQVWFWRTIAVSMFVVVTTAFFIGQWVFAIESQTKDNTIEIVNLKSIDKDIDTVKNQLKILIRQKETDYHAQFK
jgi:hypothetical protein